jgi:FAD:protein FMN transferase
MITLTRKITISAVFFFCLGTIIFTIQYGRPAELESNYQLVMGTFARVVVVAPNHKTAERCIESAFYEIRKVDELMSDYKDDSDIGIANSQAYQKPVQVSESTYEVLQKSIEVSKLSEGAFDITVGPIVALFRQAKETLIPPTQEQINQAKSKVGFQKLILNEKNRTVQFAVEGMRLDLGGIAKGYSADKAIEKIQSLGALGAMVSVGGEVRCFGKAPRNAKSWVIGLQDPNLANEQGMGLVMTLSLPEGAVSTSGDYQQFVMIEGQKYHHIIDSKTGSSAASGLSSVTIIAENTTDTDALATTVSIIGAEKGLALIEKLPNTEAILITSPPESKILKTSGANKYINE